MKAGHRHNNSSGEQQGVAFHNDSMRKPLHALARTQNDLFQMASDLAWTEDEQRQLRTIYGTALQFDQKPVAEMATGRTLKGEKA